METKDFKKIVATLLLIEGFSRKGNNFRLIRNEATILIGFQKSSYSQGYYINIGYLILKPDRDNFNPINGDIRARFTLEVEDKRTDFFDLEKLQADKLIDCVKKNIAHYIYGITSKESLRAFLNDNPVMLYQTTLDAKQLLGI